MSQSFSIFYSEVYQKKLLFPPRTGFLHRISTGAQGLTTDYTFIFCYFLLKSLDRQQDQKRKKKMKKNKPNMQQKYDCKK